ncbi:MAG: antibiotic biosynthesis monooxygenase [Candidatus Dormibacteraeota bacterium]|nr:antibiotic biosynthesis monooxygenase [Candidatus Dormibacteraeota bacterium]MDQ6900382.1 antibiotic biosynthesis monooxygenase [Candidatus Dormibacteraeota bacterium]
MIVRVWHGWASSADARAYEDHFKTEVLRHLKQIDGFRAAQLWRRGGQGEVEFVAVTSYESIDSVRAFAGSDYERAVVEPQARRVLLRFDERCKHYELAVSGTDTEEARGGE